MSIASVSGSPLSVGLLPLARRAADGAVCATKRAPIDAETCRYPSVRAGQSNRFGDFGTNAEAAVPTVGGRAVVPAANPGSQRQVRQAASTASPGVGR